MSLQSPIRGRRFKIFATSWHGGGRCVEIDGLQLAASGGGEEEDGGFPHHVHVHVACLLVGLE